MKIPLVAKHMQLVDLSMFKNEDYEFCDAKRVNIDRNGGLACSRASRPYTSAMTPGHQLPGGWTPSGKYRTAKYVPAKMDKRAGK